MVEEPEQYNLAAIRRVLLNAFNTDELDDLFYFAGTAELRATRNEYAPNDSLRTKIRKAMDYCERRDLLGQLLGEIEQVRPEQVELLRAELQKAERARQEAERRQAEQMLAEQVDRLLAAGMAHLEKGEWRLANQAFQQVLGLSPEHAEARQQELITGSLIAGQDQLKAGRWSEAIAQFQAVLEIEPGHAEAGRLLEEAEAQQRAQQEAEERARREEEARKLERARAEQIDGLMAQGMEHLEDGKWWLASEAFRQVLVLVPDHDQAQASLKQAEQQEEIAGSLVKGQNYFRASRWQEAIACFEAVIEIDPTHQEAAELLTWAQARERARLDEEARQAEEARDAQLREEVFQAERTRLFDEGCAAAQEKDWSKAIERFEAVLGIEPNYLDTADRLAQARARRDEARKLVLARQEAEASAKREAEAHQAELARQEAEARAKREEEAREAELFRLYYVACVAAWNSNWPKAIESFEALLLRDLHYRDAADRLQEVRTLQRKQQQAALRRKQSEQWDGLLGTRTSASDMQLLGAIQLPRLRWGPNPPADVLQRHREIMAAGKSPSQQQAAGKPAASPKPSRWEAVANLTAYSCDVDRAAFSPDSKRLVTAGTGDGDKSARVWEVATGKLAVELPGHSDRVWCAAFGPDGKFVVTVSGDGRARLWEAATGKMVTELRVHKKIFGSGWYAVIRAAFSPDCERLATLSGDGKVRLWAVATEEMVAEFGGKEQSARSLHFSPDGRWLLTGDKDGAARIREVQTGKVMKELREDARELQDAAFSADGKWIVTGSEGGKVRIWEVASSRIVHTLIAHEYRAVRSVAFHPSGKWVVTASLSDNALVWSVSTGKIVAKLSGSSAYHVSSAVFSPDGTLAVTAGIGAKVWRVPAE